MTIASAQSVLAIARGEIGYVGGPGPTSKYGEWYGINPGDWCAMFISWCGDQAAKQTHTTNPYVGMDPSSDHGFAYTPTGFAALKGQGKAFYDTKKCRPGDLVFYDYGMGRISHVGLVESVDTNGYVTIEGNTYSSGTGRNGNACASHKHSHGESVFRGIGRPIYGNAGPIPTNGGGSAPAIGDTVAQTPIPAGSNHIGTAGWVIIGVIVMAGLAILVTQTL